nr:reverse transcriptase domain-containing protein [Tanacetum cinerariifolium]
YVITHEGIKPCPDKTTAVLQLPSPQTIKEVQSLNGKLASLNSGASVPPVEATSVSSPSVGSTQTSGRTDYVYVRYSWSHQCSPADRTGDGTDASLLHKPCVTEYIIKEIHEGSCSMHAGPWSVVAKAIQLGNFWPTMHKDAQDMIRKCSDCQRIDISGPFPEGPGKVKFLIVAMDYFTKWIEAKAVATIIGGQFADNPFKDWCDKLNITQHFASVKHPQSNGLMERANRSLGEGIKARLGEGNKNWVEELPHVLWDHRTMVKSSHDDTPFSLTYGTEAVKPAEIGMPTYR